MEVVTIETQPLGDRSYLVHDGSVGLVIDPQRDIDRVERALGDAGVTLTHVAETHVHNDYVSGGLALARRHGATYLVSAADDVSFDRHGVLDGEQITAGGMTVGVIATPGHTDNHVAYLVSHGGRQAVFSGGSLLYGSVGRTDLVDPARTRELTHAQYRSARCLVEVSSADATVHPTHGFGSFCSSGPASGQGGSTVGEQQQVNHALTDDDEEHFVEQLIAGLSAYPSYYAHMGALNRAGGGPPDLSVPEPVDPAELRRRITEGQSVVDLRNRVAFADGHLAGTLNFEHGPMFTTFLGWTLPWGQPFTLVGSREQVEAAIRDLSRIGIDSPDAALGEDVAALGDGQPVTSYPRVGWPEVARARRDGTLDVLLDVRRDEEYDTDHLPGAVHVPLQHLRERLNEVPAGQVWVHCGSGYRAAIAASVLQRADRDVVHIDAMYADAPQAGLEPVSASTR
ncbi:MAG: MBL fold metallo-hydrolase [Pseudonocardiaceae bacterium]|nr:MBL fold metallo-hydrolase [Pseudonocardiaceae bacterium]